LQDPSLRRPNRLNRLWPWPVYTEEAGRIARLLLASEETLLYPGPARPNLFYTTRAIQSPSTELVLPFETPVLVSWAGGRGAGAYNIRAELPDNLNLDALIMREWSNKPEMTAARGLASILQRGGRTLPVQQINDTQTGFRLHPPECFA